MNLEDLYRLLRSEHVQAQGIIDTLDEPLLVLDQTGRVLTGNREFFETFRVARDDTIGRSLFALGAGQWDIPELRRLLGDIIPKSAAIIAYEVKADFPAIGRRTMLVSARRLVHPDNISTSILILFEDVTDRRALATQTTVEGQSGEEYRDAFLGRFEAVMRAEDLALAGSAEDDLSARRYSGTFNDLWDATYGDGSFFAVGRYKTVIQAQPAAPPSIQSLTTTPSPPALEFRDCRARSRPGHARQVAARQNARWNMASWPSRRVCRIRRPSRLSATRTHSRWH